MSLECSRCEQDVRGGCDCWSDEEPAAKLELKMPEGVPASVPIERIQELVAALGLPLSDLIGFRLHAKAIEAEFYARDGEGHRFILGNGDAAIHTIAIPVERAKGQS